MIRVPDAYTQDILIADKLTSVNWSEQRAQASSFRVYSLSVILGLCNFILAGSDRQGVLGWSRNVLKRIKTPFIRAAILFGIRRMAGKFVLGRTMNEAMKKAETEEAKGFLYSFDMLGEGAYTQEDAEYFFEAYKDSITALAPRCISPDYRDNHGISIKLSAIHPRYEWTQKDRVLVELVDKVTTLSMMAKDANMGISIDAEEANRLELSLEVIRKVLSHPELAGWDGFGIVVQAYGKSAPHVLEWLYELAKDLDRKIAIRLVKGAYWDYEIKQAQLDGLADFPVYASKAATDVSYLCCARKLLRMTDRIYPQFAGHNAHTVASILEFADTSQEFEFQRIHGMGEALHGLIKERRKTKCRIYAPVGNHRELLPYLARRMLENGANSSFVNQMANPNLSAEEIVTDPFALLDKERVANFSPVARPRDMFEPDRKNSKGWDIRNPQVLAEIEAEREPFRTVQWHGFDNETERRDLLEPVSVYNPASPEDLVGYTRSSTPKEVEATIAQARPWADSSTKEERAEVLVRASNLYEDHACELMALLCREAGKTLNDAVNEIREAVDFLRYYSAELLKQNRQDASGIVSCISPWNFPLAIFTGQISAALSSGNGVVAKPSEQTELIAHKAVGLLHRAGVPTDVLQLVRGTGPTVGTQLISNAKITGVAFTGSTQTAKTIQRKMADHLSPNARLIAETGGLNAMIVDSTALPEQVVRDVVVSSFQSAGQRCSALRFLYIQEDVEDTILTMLFGAMDQLRIGNPWDSRTDIGPLIDAAAHDAVSAYIQKQARLNRILKQCDAPSDGHFVGPTVIGLSGIEELETEIFGPVLHVASFNPGELDSVIDAINGTGFGLTFGLHSRMDQRVDRVVSKIRAGNIYVNRNQIGAVVGSQPFGGEGLSGTGPKVGGPELIHSLACQQLLSHPVTREPHADLAGVQSLLASVQCKNALAGRTVKFPGPTGETNVLNYYPKGTVLCLGPTPEDSREQARMAQSYGCAVVQICPEARGNHSVSGFLPRECLTQLGKFDAVALWSTEDDLRSARQALADRDGKFIPLIVNRNMEELLHHERLVCTDTTAAGGNATLFATVRINLA